MDRSFRATGDGRLLVPGPMGEAKDAYGPWSELAKFVKEIDPLKDPLTYHAPQHPRKAIKDNAAFDFDMFGIGHNGYHNLGPQTESLIVFANLGIEGQPLPAGEGSELAQLCKLCASRRPPLTPARSYPASPPPHPVAMWFESITALQSDVFLLPCSPADITAPEPTHGVPGESRNIRLPPGAIILQFAENDERVNAGWPAYEGALKKAGVQYTAHHYPGTNHGFHNDTTPRYDEAAPKLAWQRTLEFFNRELAGK